MIAIGELASIAIPAIAGLAGNAMSASGQESTNDTSAAIAAANNATQIQLAQNAMSYRFQDYKNAGVNPMLVTGSTGMQVPNMMMPNLQNPNAAYGQLGSQVSNAMQLATQSAQIAKLRADAKLTAAQTPGDVVALNDDGSPDYTRATGGTLGNLSAASMAQSIKNAQATWDQIQASVKQTGAQTSLTEVQSAIAGLDKAQLQATLQALIHQQLAETKITEANVPAAEAGAKIMEGNAGVWIKGIQTALGIVGQAASMAPGVGRAIGAARGAPDIYNVRLPQQR